MSRGDPPAIHFFRLFLVSRMMNERRCSVEDLRVEIMSRAENGGARCLHSIQAPLQSIHDEAGWLPRLNHDRAGQSNRMMTPIHYLITKANPSNRGTISLVNECMSKLVSGFSQWEGILENVLSPWGPVHSQTLISLPNSLSRLHRTQR